MHIYKKLSVFISIAIVAITLAVNTNAQNPDQTARRLKYITNQGPSPVQAIEIGVPKKKSVSLDKSELTSFEDARLLERETFDLINLRRLDQGLSELKWNERIADLARRHSQNMAVHGFFSHIGLHGDMVDSRAVDFGLDDWNGIGENIAFNKGLENPSSFAVERWMLSNGHRNNLLDPVWTESGLGVAITVDGKYFFTQIFMAFD